MELSGWGRYEYWVGLYFLKRLFDPVSSHPPHNQVWVLDGFFIFFHQKFSGPHPEPEVLTIQLQKGKKKLDGKYQTLFKPALQQEINISCYESKIVRGRNEPIEEMECAGGGPVGSLKSPLKRFW